MPECAAKWIRVVARAEHERLYEMRAKGTKSSR